MPVIKKTNLLLSTELDLLESSVGGAKNVLPVRRRFKGNSKLCRHNVALRESNNINTKSIQTDTTLADQHLAYGKLDMRPVG